MGFFFILKSADSKKYLSIYKYVVIDEKLSVAMIKI